MRRLFAALAIPLSLAPLALMEPRVAHELGGGRHAAGPHDRGRLPALLVRAPLAARIPPHPDAVPVLAYHGVALHGRAPDRWTVTRAQLAAQLAALRRSGYVALDARTYVRFVRGEPVRLPPRPILITFDDGRLDSFQGADAILQREGMHAVMFAIAQYVAEGAPAYLHADELRQMVASGRWDVAFHAGWGHRQVRAAGGGTGGFYATREPGESLGGFRARVVRDVDAGTRRLATLVPGARTDLFAVPFSDYGQWRRGDPRIPGILRRWWTRRFAATFVQHDRPAFSRPRPHDFVGRFEVQRGTSTRDVLAWLRAGARRSRRTRDRTPRRRDLCFTSPSQCRR